jgi:hypothetical protein
MRKAVVSSRFGMLVGLAAAIGLSLAGCAQDDGLPTLKEKGAKSSASPETEQGAQAELFASCLKEAGVPIELTDEGDGQKRVNPSQEQPYAMALGDGSTSFGSGAGGTEAEWEAANTQLAALVEKYDAQQAQMLREAGVGGGGFAMAEGVEPGTETPENPKYLVVGETDYTDALVKCLDESGYEEPVYRMDPADELKQKQQQAEASTRWARCARDNGFADVKDPDAPTADEGQTWPMALLPTTITELELRELLDKCPSFDIEAHRAWDQAMESMDDNASEADWDKLWEEYSVADPTIGFDAPGWDGQVAEPKPTDPALDEHLAKLTEILLEAQAEYYGQDGGIAEVPEPAATAAPAE